VLVIYIYTHTLSLSLSHTHTQTHLQRRHVEDLSDSTHLRLILSLTVHIPRRKQDFEEALAHRPRPDRPLLRRQYLYLCTCKASKLSTQVQYKLLPGCLRGRCSGVSICTFVLVTQATDYLPLRRRLSIGRVEAGSCAQYLYSCTSNASN
jgi:hypothetical protein